MEWRLIRSGNTLELSDRKPFDVVSVDGIGLSPVRRLTERGPFEVGFRDVGYRYDARLLNMVLISHSTDRAAADAARDALFAQLRPSDEPLILRAVRDDGAIRQIDVHAARAVDAPVSEADRIWSMQRYALQMLAPFPYFYDPTPGFWLVLGAADPQQSGSDPNQTQGYQVPTSVPTITVESSGLDYVYPVEYAGSADSFPVITIYGPASGVVITNETTETTLSLPNLALADGEWIEMDLAYDAKTVVDDAGNNRIAELAISSDIATWRLAPGTNQVRITIGSGATAATGVKMVYVIQYISL